MCHNNFNCESITFRAKIKQKEIYETLPISSVGDPDPQDLHAFGPPGSGSKIKF
jgi:hypothetical protein